MYLLLMWGYLILPNAQWYAAFLALILSAMLVFWVTESMVAATLGGRRSAVSASVRSAADRPGLTMPDWQSRPDLPCGGDLSVSVQDLQHTMARLDALKSELTQQYAQFGRDQSALNRGGLGSWNGRKDQYRPS